MRTSGTAGCRRFTEGGHRHRQGTKRTLDAADREAASHEFGRKSEKLDRQIEQLELRLKELEANVGVAPIEIPKMPRTAPEQIQRKPLPEHLPREIQTHLPTSGETCTECGATMKLLGEDACEQLEYVPASFRAIRHIRPKSG